MIPVAINMKRGEKKQEAQKMPSNDEEAIGRIGIVMRPETSGKKAHGSLPVLLAAAVCGRPMPEAAARRSMLL